MKQISTIRHYYRPTLIPQLLGLGHAPILTRFSASLRVLRASAVKKTRRWRLVEVNAIGTGTGTIRDGVLMTERQARSRPLRPVAHHYGVGKILDVAGAFA